MSFETQLLTLRRERDDIGEPKTHGDEEKLDQVYESLSKLRKENLEKKIYAVEFEELHYLFSNIEDRKKFINSIKEDKSESLKLDTITVKQIGYPDLPCIDSNHECTCDGYLGRHYIEGLTTDDYDKLPDDYDMTIDEYNGHYTGDGIAILERQMEELQRRMREREQQQSNMIDSHNPNYLFNQDR